MACGVVTSILVTWFSFACTSVEAMGGQELVNYLGKNLGVAYTIVKNDNGSLFEVEIELKNGGGKKIASTDWEIYFCHIRLIEPATIRPNGTELGSSGFKAFHVNGCLHKLVPSVGFKELLAGNSVTIAFQAQYWQVAVTDVMPNWYVVTSGATPVTLKSTAGESLDFVAPLTKPNQLRRTPDDHFKPLTPADRFVLNENVTSIATSDIEVVPTPLEVSIDSSRRIKLDRQWVIVKTEALATEAAVLAVSLNLSLVQQQPSSHYVIMETGDVMLKGAVSSASESYRVEVDADKPAVRVVGRDTAGVFYGVQTLISLALDKRGIPNGHIADQPRYPYRGLMLDVARNFRSKDEVLQLIDVMAMYKLNKLHFHLADDEGWRLEIPGLLELTRIGSKRCHDLQEKTCTLSQLGSGPTSSGPGSGFYTKADYKEILVRAASRHVEVIPEFDSPGHARAAVIAMATRDEFNLRDTNDSSQYFSVQMFNDNAMDPCLDSTYKFIRYVVEEVKKMHEDIQPLKVFHFGGDEVARGAWVNSPACLALSDADRQNLKQRFATKVAQIVNDEGMDLAGWEDGLMSQGNEPFTRSLFPNNHVFVNAWQNIWEWGGGSRAYRLANSGYKVVISHATHLYFDHPQEPHPEERGYYWATRYTDTRKVFDFLPDNIYDNMDTDRMGKLLNRSVICADQACPPLDAVSKVNVIGTQGHLWSETVRTEEQSHEMLFPRVLALAERAWHKAAWEIDVSKEETDALRDEDWKRFANALGSKELARLDALGITYRVPPPGARVTSKGVLEVNVGLPGLSVEYSVDKGQTWSVCQSKQSVTPDTEIRLRTKSADGTRTSSVVSLLTQKKQEDEIVDSATSLAVSGMCLSLGLLVIALANP